MEQTRGQDKDKLGEVSKIETGTEDFGVGGRGRGRGVRRVKRETKGIGGG